MEIALLIVSILLIAIVLLQSGNSDLFSNRKERGVELFISRLTFALGLIFFVLCMAISIWG